MKKYFWVLIAGFMFGVTGCDLQPQIAAIPDNVGDFISERYPTLLADPDSEIYQTAVSDYGVYSSATEYGNGDVDDYVLYSPADDYTMPAQDTYVAPHDAGMPADEDANDYGYEPDADVEDLHISEYEKQDLIVADKKPVVVQKSEPAPAPVEKPLDAKHDKIDKSGSEIIVARGDTLYALSRKYDVKPDDLAAANKISAPFTLKVGQKLKLPEKSDDKKVVASAHEKKPDVKPEPKPTVETKSQPRAATKNIVDEKAKSVQKASIKPETKPQVAPKSTNNVREITVARGDTLYSLSRKYAVPVNDLAVMNKISAPFTVSAGQKLKIPADTNPDVRSTQSENKSVNSEKIKDTKKVADKKTDNKKSNTEKTKTQRVDTKKTSDKKADAQANKKTDKKSDKKTNAKQDNKKAKAESKSRQNTQKMVARSSSKFSWPVRGKILSGYGSKSNGLFNDGINIQAARGTAVSAAENGYVAYAGNEVKGMGNLVIIQHSDGWMTVYAHMNSMNVRRGHSVAVGQKIGTVGSSGKVDQPQLHFEIRKGTKAYNPINYLKK